jgi:hypothetical protein
MGTGRGNSSLRAVRLGAFVLVILAGVVFHHSGGVYQTIHLLYLVLVVGVLGYALLARSRRGNRSPSGGVGGSWGGVDTTHSAAASPSPHRVPDPFATDQHVGIDESKPDAATE